MSKTSISWKSIWIYLKSQFKFWNLKIKFKSEKVVMHLNFFLISNIIFETAWKNHLKTFLRPFEKTFKTIFDPEGWECWSSCKLTKPEIIMQAVQWRLGKQLNEYLLLFCTMSKTIWSDQIFEELSKFEQIEVLIMTFFPFKIANRSFQHH